MQRGSRNSDGADKEGMGNGSESGKEGGKEAVELGTGASEGGREAAVLRCVAWGKATSIALCPSPRRPLAVYLSLSLSVWHSGCEVNVRQELQILSTHFILLGMSAMVSERNDVGHR